MDAPTLLREWYARKGRELPAAIAEAETMDDVTAVKA